VCGWDFHLGNISRCINGILRSAVEPILGRSDVHGISNLTGCGKIADGTGNGEAQAKRGLVPGVPGVYAKDIIMESVSGIYLARQNCSSMEERQEVTRLIQHKARAFALRLWFILLYM
jgi:hypothetical protein